MAQCDEISSRDASSKRQPALVFHLSDASTAACAGTKGPSFTTLLARRPEAAVHLIPKSVVLFTAGAMAGGMAKSITAPLDRVRIMFQVRGGLQTGAIKEAIVAGNLKEAFLAVGREEGIRGYWRGNIPQLLRIVPYSAVNLYAYETFKKAFSREDGHLSIPSRLCAGACSGMTATLVTYPLDTLRLRLAVDPKLRTLTGAAATLLREGGPMAFYRGLGPCLLGIAPYMALELATFDLLAGKCHPVLRGFCAALTASSITYPLDTVRRQIQLNSTGGMRLWNGVEKAVEGLGWKGLYVGWLPSIMTNMPNKGIRLSTFDQAKKLILRADIAYEEELQKEAGGSAAAAFVQGVQPLQMSPISRT